MTPDHYDISELINKYLHDTISDIEYSVLKEWLDEDVKNQQLFDDFKKTEKLQARLYILDQVDFDKGWKAVQIKQRKYENRRSIPYLRIAAILVVILGLSFYFSRNQPIKKPQLIAKVQNKIDFLPAGSVAQLELSDGDIVNLAKQSFDINEANGVKIVGENGELTYKNENSNLFKSLIYNTITVPKKGFYKITLSDGTKVWLNADSKLSYPVRFSSFNRKVKLSGEAYFEVNKDNMRPFSVEVQNQTVRVLGTKFNVNTYKNYTKTTLLEGSVMVMVSDKSEKLFPGQEALFDSKDINVYNADIQKVMAWKNGKFLFRKETIMGIMDEVSRWYDIEIVYKGNDFDKKFTGDISRSLKLPEVLEMLRFLSDYEFELKDRNVTVSQKVINQ